MEVENVVRHWLSMTVEYDVIIHDGLGHGMGQIMRVFYADYGIIGYMDPEWLQWSSNVLIGLFRHIGLVDNIAKY